MRGTGRPAVRILVLAVIVLTGVLGPASGATAADVLQRNAVEPNLVDQINQVRRNHGLRKLSASDVLNHAAQRHASNMAWKGYFKHDFKKEGNWYSFSTWIRWYWPGPDYTSWAAGENLAWGAPSLTASKAVTMWMNSPEHRANLLGRWSRVGVGIVHVSNPGGYFNAYSDVTIIAAEFGRRSK
jgi:uncharacterized protein YkwD